MSFRWFALSLHPEMKQTVKITKRNYLRGFVAIVVLLALLRVACPTVAKGGYYGEVDEQAIADSILAARQLVDTAPCAVRITDGRHTLPSAPDYAACFPDTNAVQKQSAELHGVTPVQNREEAEQRKSELVYIGSSPYYDLRELTSSIPYLVPSAALLLQDIGRGFADSLYAKRLPMCRPYVTSVLRTKDDLADLLRHNRNASPNSCHLYGTTFDISYARFSADGSDVEDERMKRILAEVLDELRRDRRCWVKHERLQPVFHITVR